MTRLGSAIAMLALTSAAAAQQGGAGATALTIYNQNFAVARTTVDLDLKAGTNEVTTTNVTTQLEMFEITVKNQKTTPVDVAVVEHLNRGQNWQLTQKSGDFARRDSNTIAFPVTVSPAGEAKVTYTVHYTW